MKFLTNPLYDTSSAGLYIHIPFCEKKCAYCDFYSSFYSEELMDSYLAGLLKALKKWGGAFSRPINTVYLGGGTPSLLGKRVIPLLKSVRDNFSLSETAEITMEINPSRNITEIVGFAKDAGINRLSIGAQSGNDRELNLLGRTHSGKDIEKAVSTARNAGFDNISLDIMLGLPGSSTESLKESLDFITGLNPEHISAYILKVEENTLFYRNRNSLDLPDDDTQAEQYLLMCRYLEDHGYNHYEISNFCKKGMESRHNIKYWNVCEYIGIGPSAHSFLNGKRFFYPRDIKSFLKGNTPVEDGEGGDMQEYIMLRLRLSDGINISDLKTRYGLELPQAFIDKCKAYEKVGLVKTDENRFSLTDSGMLVSNSIITELMECIE